MDVHLVKLGVKPELHALVRALCVGFDRVTEMRRSVGAYVTCTECGCTVPIDALA